MRLHDICIRNVVSVERRMPINEAARLMRSRHVGALVVVDAGRRGPNPVGIVTDRDIVVEVLAAGLDPASLTVGDIMPVELITATADQEVFEVVEQMQHHGVRRMPVVDNEGVLFGIIAVDDLLDFLAMHFTSLTKAIATERRHELAARA
jgi:CBS domain-containing protein